MSNILDKADQIMNEAVEKAGELLCEKPRVAELILRQLLRCDPEHLAGLQLMGLCKHRLGENAEAVEIISTAIELDPSGRRVTLAGQEIDLTQREFDLAVVFLQNVGRVLGRDELLSTVWAREADVDTRTVDTHTSRLRKKLGLAGESGLMLTSVYGQGYRLDTVKA